MQTATSLSWFLNLYSFCRNKKEKHPTVDIPRATSDFRECSVS